MYQKTLCYVLDLACSPYSFDIYHILGVMEYERAYQGLENIHLVIIPENIGRAKQIDVQLMTKQDNAWREIRIIVENFYLLNTIKGYSLFHTREEGSAFVQTHFQHVYPPVYKTLSQEEKVPLIEYYNHLPLNMILRWLRDEKAPFITNLQPSVIAKDYIEKWCDARLHGRKLIVLNLREAKYWLERNSSLERWANFCKQLDPAEYAIVVLRDFDKNMEPLPDFFPEVFSFPEAVLAQELRVALYQRADMVLGDSVGTSVPMLFVPGITSIYILLHLDMENISAVSTMAFSLIYKQKLLFTTPRQLFIIEEKTKPIDIFRIFQKFEKKVQNPKLQKSEFIEQFMLKQKENIIKNDVLYHIALNILSANQQRISIYMAYIMLCRALETLPPKMTDSLQMLFQAINIIFGFSVSRLDIFSERNRRLFQALDAFHKGNIQRARELLLPDQQYLATRFPYPNHWTRLIFNNNINQQLGAFLILDETPENICSHITCPVCSFKLENNGKVNVAVSALLLNKRTYFCFRCLQPLKPNMRLAHYQRLDALLTDKIKNMRTHIYQLID